MVTQRKSEVILEEIKNLIEELAVSIGLPQRQVGSKKPVVVPKTSKNVKGASGAISLLLDEGFFDTPREFSAVLERLKGIGHYHKRNAISMNLLNRTKRRELNRFRNKETHNWEYVVRR